MKGQKSVFVCGECGLRSPKWLGRCTSCGSWNTLAEEAAAPPDEPARRHGISAALAHSAAASRFPAPQGISQAAKSPAQFSGLSDDEQNESRVSQQLSPDIFSSNREARALRLSELEDTEHVRINTGVGELDRVLGGGLVAGSAVLLCGEPGIGKSTLLLQICGSLCGVRGLRVLYVSGEESRSQLKLRAGRLNIGVAAGGGESGADRLFILNATNIESIAAECVRVSPDIIIVDSIQTIYTARVSSMPGSVTQVRECALSFIEYAKLTSCAVFLVGHVNKEGSIAGPKVLEHMVDAVLYFEGERHHSHRIIRAVKNRYGSTNELGLFEMTGGGLKEIANPSEALLADRPKGVSGSCAVCVIEGTRPIIAEIQALVTPTVFPSPRRTSSGVDYNRVCLILAVLEKRLGLRFSANDVYINVIGGLRIEDPAADLAVSLALISSIRDKPVPDDLVAVGELGLSGECRTAANTRARVREAQRLGFARAVIPGGVKSIEKSSGDEIRLIQIKSVFETLKLLGSDTGADVK